MLIFILLGATTVLWLIYRKRCFSVLKKLGIPGPEPNLLFGNLLELMKKNPLECQNEWISKYGKVMGYYFGTNPVVVISDLDLVKQIEVSQFQNFINRPNIAHSRFNISQREESKNSHLLLLRDQRWKDIRSIITPIFTSSKLKQMTPIMHDLMESFMKNVDKKSQSGKSFDIYPIYQGLALDVIGRTTFGIRTDCQNNPNDLFLRTIRVLFSRNIRSSLLLLTVSFQSLQKLWTWLEGLRLFFLSKGTYTIKEFLNSINYVISSRRNNKEYQRPDLLQIMMDAERVEDTSKVTSDDLTAEYDEDIIEKQEKGSMSGSSPNMVRKLTDEDIMDNIILFLLAGYETTSSTLAFTTHLLIHHPEMQEEIRREIQEVLISEDEIDYYSSLNKLKYLEQVIKESLRLYPPLYSFVNREVKYDVDLGNVRLTKGMAVQIPVYFMHRDPELWGPDAHEFKPDRFSPENKSNMNPFAFQAFGGGPRNCVGMRFALMEVKFALVRLMSKYKLEACPETDKENISLKISPIRLNPKNGVWARLIEI